MRLSYEAKDGSEKEVGDNAHHETNHLNSNKNQILALETRLNHFKVQSPV